MKYILIPLILILFITTHTYAQNGREVHGSVIDSTKLTLPGSSVRLISNLGDSTITTTDIDGKFNFSNIKGTKITLYIASIGYQAIIKHYTVTATDNNPLMIDPIVLKSQSRRLKEVTIVGVNPVAFKEDTVDYKIAAYKVRENAPVEDVLKKIPGVDVDANGNVSAQGKSITKVRINGKDYMGGDVQAATKNIPADILESVQVIDDYGDQANLTGVKTGEPNKILNFTIRADKNYGYSVQGTVGDGRDFLPEEPGVTNGDPGVTNSNRYIGSVNAFDFKGNRQITVLGNINNTNTNTFNFGGGGGGGGGGGFRGGGGGGGRGNALRGGGGANAALASTASGITDAHAIGTNYRDQWGKYLSVYGSYSFSDNTTSTNTSSLQINHLSIPSTSSSIGTQKDNPVNHRFQFNLEYKPDTINYLKITPSFTYAGTNTHDLESVTSTRNDVTNQAYTSTSVDNSQSPSGGLNVLYNHRFPHRRNLSIYANVTAAQTQSYDNPIYQYTAGVPSAPLNQVINTNNHTTTFGANLSYLEPLGKASYLEFNYAYNHSITSNDKETDTLSVAQTYNNYALLSNNYKFTFTTNKFGLNYRVIEQKYNFTLGVGVQPSTLDGQSITTGTSTHVNQVNFIPTARYIYNFSRNESFSVNYNGSSSQPSFSQLQPVIDYSNALYPVQGNPNLKPQFTNNFSLRYYSFGIASGNIMFINGAYTNTSNYVASNTITYPTKFTAAVLAQNPALARLQNTNLTQYINSDGYSSVNGQFVFSKPWQERRYTVIFNGSIGYVTSPNYSNSIDSNNVASAVQKNISKALTLSPGLRFRLDITDIIDAQASGNYAITHNDNSLKGGIYDQNNDTRQLTLALTGKNYLFTDWTFSYDYTKQFNYGYASSLGQTNPNVLSVYLERRFLKNNRATLRIAAFDLFNQNTGFSTTVNGGITTQSNVNRLGRYYLATFAFRLQKFAGRAPTQDRDYRRDGDGGGRGTRGGGFGGGRGGSGGPGGGGPGGPQ